MRDRTKVIIGFGSIWGLFAFGALLYGSFTLGANVTLPEVVALALYGLTILPFVHHSDLLQDWLPIGSSLSVLSWHLGLFTS